MRDWRNYKFWLSGYIYGHLSGGPTASLIDLALGRPDVFPRFDGPKALTGVLAAGSWRAAKKAIARP